MWGLYKPWGSAPCSSHEDTKAQEVSHRPAAWWAGGGAPEGFECWAPFLPFPAPVWYEQGISGWPRAPLLLWAGHELSENVAGSQGPQKPPPAGSTAGAQV